MMMKLEIKKKLQKEEKVRIRPQAHLVSLLSLRAAEKCNTKSIDTQAI